MKPLYCISLFLFLTASPLFSQKKVSTTIEKVSGFASNDKIQSKIKVLDNYYFLTFKSGKYTIKKFTSDLEFVSQNEFPFDDKKLLSMNELGGKILLIYEVVLNNSTLQTFGQFFDPKQMKLESKEVLLHNHLYRKEYVKSFVQNNFLVSVNNKIDNGRREMFPTVKLLDHKMNEVWTKEIKDESKNFSIFDLIISKTGEINAQFTQTEKYYAVETYIKKIPFDDSQNVSKSIRVSDYTKNFGAAKLSFGSNNDILFYGQYTTGVGNQIGTFVLTLDEELFKKLSYSEIIHSAETLSQDQPKSIKKEFKKHYDQGKVSNKRGVEVLRRFNKIGTIVPREDGGFFIVNSGSREELYSSITTEIGQEGSSSVVLVTSVNKKGEIIADQIIPKFSKNSYIQLPFSNAIIVDFAYTNFNNSLYFIFNDNSANFPPGKKFKDFKGKVDQSSLFLVKIDEKGQMTKSVVTKNSNLKGMPIVSQSISLKENEISCLLTNDLKGNKRSINRIITVKF